MRSLFCAVLYFHIVRVSLVHGRHFKLFFNTWVETWKCISDDTWCPMACMMESDKKL